MYLSNPVSHHTFVSETKEAFLLGSLEWMCARPGSDMKSFHAGFVMVLIVMDISFGSVETSNFPLVQLRESPEIGCLPCLSGNVTGGGCLPLVGILVGALSSRPGR